MSPEGASWAWALTGTSVMLAAESAIPANKIQIRCKRDMSHLKKISSTSTYARTLPVGASPGGCEGKGPEDAQHVAIRELTAMPRDGMSRVPASANVSLSTEGSDGASQFAMAIAAKV